MDRKAKKILMKTFWSPTGWSKDRNISKEDFEYAKMHGVMFNAAKDDHDSLCKSILNKVQQINKDQIVNGFISSLSSRDLRFRSFLSSFTFSRVLTDHKHNSTDESHCTICGLYTDESVEYDLNVLNFEKIKWGGVRLLDLRYINFDLERIQEIEFIKPTKLDFEILAKIKDTILTSKNDDKPRQLEKRLSKVFKSNSAEREVVLNIFGICGILETKDQKGFFNKYINRSQREVRPVSKTDWSYPVDWWQGQNGINEDAWKYYFK